MKIFDRETIKEAAKLNDGEIFIFEYVAAGVGYQEKAVKFGDDIYYKMDSSTRNDAATGQALECYCHFDKNNEMRVAAQKLDGTFELI